MRTPLMQILDLVVRMDARGARKVRKKEIERIYKIGYWQRPEVKARDRIRQRARHRPKNTWEYARTSARYATRKAIACGDLTRKPCEVCQSPDVEAHHDDYTEILAIRWLCRSHHRLVAHPKPSGIVQGLQFEWCPVVGSRFKIDVSATTAPCPVCKRQLYLHKHGVDVSFPRHKAPVMETA